MQSKVSCLREQHAPRHRAGSNHRPSDRTSNALTTRPPRLHNDTQKRRSIQLLVVTYCWSRGGLVVSEIWTSDLEVGALIKPSLVRRVVSLDKKHYSTLPPFTQVYKWVPAIINTGG